MNVEMFLSLKSDGSCTSNLDTIVNVAYIQWPNLTLMKQTENNEGQMDIRSRWTHKTESEDEPHLHEHLKP